MMSLRLRTFIASLILTLVTVTALTAIRVSQASAATPCVVKQNSQHIVVNPDKTVTGYFEVTGDAGCTQPVSVMTWFADSTLFPDHTEFWTSQTINAVTTATVGVGVHSLTVKVPVCTTDPNVVHSYQADVIAGATPAGHINAPGTGGYYEQLQADGTGNVIDAIVEPGVCPAPKITTTSVPVTPPAPQPPKPAVLPNTGTGSILGIFAASSVASTAAHFIVRRRAAKA